MTQQKSQKKKKNHIFRTRTKRKIKVGMNQSVKTKEEDLEVEGDTGVGTDALFAGAESSEILGGFGNDIVEEFDDDSAFQLAGDGDIEEAFRVYHFGKD